MVFFLRLLQVADNFVIMDTVQSERERFFCGCIGLGTDVFYSSVLNGFLLRIVHARPRGL